MKNDLIREIVDREWRFFQQVQSLGGRASCQDDKETFEIMRRSQFAVLPEEFLNLYLIDLQAAESERRNPVSEKYAYMMRETDTEYFEKYLKDRLPVCSDAKREKINSIIDIVKAWDTELRKLYPKFASVTRPANTTSRGVSPVSYLACELETYSEATVQSYLRYAEDCVKQGRNLQIETIETTAKIYGYESIKQAESML